MNRLLHRARRDESGAALVMCLVFLGFVGVIAVPLLNLTRTSLRASVSGVETRNVIYAADGVTQGAIHVLRGVNRNAAGNVGPNCFNTTVNGMAFKADCSRDPLTEKVTITTCPASAPACTGNEIRSVAEAQYLDTGTNAPTFAAGARVNITKWSVRR
jgi:hypothetical protein